MLMGFLVIFLIWRGGGEVRVNLCTWLPHHSPPDEQKAFPFSKIITGMLVKGVPILLGKAR
jgi:hypothetical protein